MKIRMFMIAALAAGFANAGIIDRVLTVGTASVQEKRCAKRLVSERIVGKDLIGDEVAKIVREIAAELDRKGYSVKLGFVPTVGAPGSVTISVDFMTRRELKARAAAAEGASSNALSRRPSRWVPNPGGVIKRLRLRGDMDFIDDRNILDVIEPVLCGRTLTPENEKELLNAARAEIVRLGYPLAAVTAGDNAYCERNGVYTLNVEPGRFGDVTVHFGGETNSWFHSNQQVLNKVKSIKKGEIFTLEALNDTIRVLNNHPDYRVHAGVDVHGDASKVGDIVLNIDDDIPIHGNIEVNNYGMEDISAWQFTGALQITNLTRHDDVLTVSPGMSANSELWWVSAGYLLPFDFLRGGYLSIYGGLSDLRTDKLLPQFDLIGRGWFAGAKLSVNLIDNERRTLSVDAGLMFRQSWDSFDIMGISANDRRNDTLPATIALVYGDKKADAIGGRWWGDVQFQFSTYNNGNKATDYWYGADDHYFLGSFNIARNQPITDMVSHQVPEWQKWSIFGKVHGRYTDQSLASSEKLVLGGRDMVRGYRTRGYVGDWGFTGTLELRTPIWTDPVLRLFMDRADRMPITRWQFVAFADAGWLHFNNFEELRYAAYEEDEWLVSAGLGLRFSCTRFFQLGADVAFPLRKAYLDDKDRDMEFYLSSRLQF